MLPFASIHVPFTSKHINNDDKPRSLTRYENIWQAYVVTNLLQHLIRSFEFLATQSDH